MFSEGQKLFTQCLNIDGKQKLLITSPDVGPSLTNEDFTVGQDQALPSLKCSQWVLGACRDAANVFWWTHKHPGPQTTAMWRVVPEVPPVQAVSIPGVEIILLTVVTSKLMDTCRMKIHLLWEIKWGVSLGKLILPYIEHIGWKHNFYVFKYKSITPQF